MKQKLEIEIYGEVIGPIWWPAGKECSKQFSKKYIKNQPTGPLKKEIESLEEALHDIINDGDFQYCKIGHAHMGVTRWNKNRKETFYKELTPTVYKEYFCDDWPRYGYSEEE